MIDKEKVIKALELEVKYPYTWDCKSECPYYSDTECDCYTQLTIDAIELLKEQEPVMWSYDGYNCFICSNCDLHINDEVYYLMNKPISFCPTCGRKVKWDDP